MWVRKKSFYLITMMIAIAPITQLVHARGGGGGGGGGHGFGGGGFGVVTVMAAIMAVTAAEVMEAQL